MLPCFFLFARGTEGLVSDKNTLPGHHNPAGSGSDEITVKTPAEHKGPCWRRKKKVKKKRNVSRHCSLFSMCYTKMAAVIKYLGMHLNDFSFLFTSTCCVKLFSCEGIVPSPLCASVQCAGIKLGYVNKHIHHRHFLLLLAELRPLRRIELSINLFWSSAKIVHECRYF